MMEADQDGDGKLSFDEFKDMVASTDIAKQMVRRRGFFFFFFGGGGGEEGDFLEFPGNATFLGLTSVTKNAKQTLEGSFVSSALLVSFSLLRE